MRTTEVTHIEQTPHKDEQSPYIVDDIYRDDFDALAKRFRPLMWKYIRSIWLSYNKAIDVDDLEQEALLGLWRATELYDSTLGVYFPVYLETAIRNRLLSYCRNYLPHFYEKHPEHTLEKPKFKRVVVVVSNLDNSLLDTGGARRDKPEE